MSRVELIYDRDCPNVDEARSQLRQALLQANLPHQWQEWDRGDPSAPEHARQHGSPTILIDGKDVAGIEASGANCCRVYHDENGLRGVPSVATITAALGRKRSGGVLSSLGVVPALVVGSMPTLACPACWPAYAGVLGALGLGVMIDSTYLLPIVAVALVTALIALAAGASRRHGYGPLVIGLVGGVALLTGRSWFDSVPMTYGGISMFVAASVWNAWPRRWLRSRVPSCCETTVLAKEANNG